MHPRTSSKNPVCRLASARVDRRRGDGEHVAAPYIGQSRNLAAAGNRTPLGCRFSRRSLSQGCASLHPGLPNDAPSVLMRGRAVTLLGAARRCRPTATSADCLPTAPSVDCLPAPKGPDSIAQGETLGIEAPHNSCPERASFRRRDQERAIDPPCAPRPLLFCPLSGYRREMRLGHYPVLVFPKQ
jgi:hypothetical protein